TCQGVPGYVDDSTLAVQIVERLPRELRRRCAVRRSRLDARALIKAFGEFDAFIGMRLHGCLLALLGGTPAMGLSYEEKTREIFGQLGLDDFQISFQREASEWIGCANQFLLAVPSLHARLPGILDAACRRAELNLAAVQECLARRAEVSALDEEAAGSMVSA